MFDVIAMRSYVATRDAMDTAKELKDQPVGPMVEVVKDIEYELWQERNQQEGDDMAGEEGA